MLLADGLTDATITSVPILEYHLPPAKCFAMRHLQVSGSSPRRCVALLRPLSAGQAPLTVRTVGEHGIRVTGDGVDDTIVLSREAVCAEVDGRGRRGFGCGGCPPARGNDVAVALPVVAWRPTGSG